MNKYLFLLLLFILGFNVYAYPASNVMLQDTNEVIKFNKQGYDSRLTDPEQTLANANRALDLSKKLNYVRGIGESYRVLGIGYYYLNEAEKSIDNYLKALEFFRKINDLQSEAKVYNNIGNLFRDNDYDQSLNYLNKSLVIALKLQDRELIASLYLNIGNIKYRQKSFNQALDYYNRSSVLFSELKDSVNIIKCIQNKGVIYFYLNDYNKSEKLLLQANQAAKRHDLNQTVASINLTLASLYIAKDKFAEAVNIVEEGKTYSNIIKDQKLIYDYEYTNYQLEYKRKNYEKALRYLQDIYRQDSTLHKSNESTKITLIQKQFEQAETERKTALLLQRQAYDKQRFFGVLIVAILLLAVVGLLIGNVKRKAKTNAQLTDLNAEVSKQKDNLDRINHHLEEIIDERTKDLQVKNRKLSEYSSYLSHQIRGPIATLKGLMNLEKEGLVDQNECIRMMDKCVSDIDSKIIEMSDMLHNPAKDVQD
ncbi:tetratricopeptide repeat protein [Mucilaginibacter sp. UR6-1]|uniref:tetratricopeptide repeat protein n=1 Tax=Mucilaginibacter sp. UR6-1 TaxID=1435643 RepID=UPI001E42B216|nr:tetratricopeptide repeat protein [Mucilaginibacter sp. UR6-1]MCC8407339.1 tetratricopeptide repeat protein [Mucilaginibacter sp. UR6-1]